GPPSAPPDHPSRSVDLLGEGLGGGGEVGVAVVDRPDVLRQGKTSGAWSSRNRLSDCVSSPPGSLLRPPLPEPAVLPVKALPPTGAARALPMPRPLPPPALPPGDRQARDGHRPAGFDRAAVPPDLLATRPGQRTGLLQQAMQPGQYHEENPLEERI